jgi:hypothetical protein
MEWYYSNNGQQAGPVSEEQLAELFRNGTVKPSVLVWNETMTEWTPIGKVDAFAVPAPELPTAAPPAPVDSPPTLSAAPPLAAAPVTMSASPQGFAPSGMAEPSTYLWQSIVVMLLCCLPLGIPALIFSTKVKPAFASGDYAAAMEASKKAKLFCILSLVIGLIVQVIYIGINIAVFMSTAAQSGNP